MNYPLTCYHFSMHLEYAKHQSQPYTTAFNQLMLKLILQALLTLLMEDMLHHVGCEGGNISALFSKNTLDNHADTMVID